MTQLSANLPLPKSRGQIIFEYVLLILSLCVLALRATYSAGPDINIAGQPVNAADAWFDATMSTLLVLFFCLWLLWLFYTKNTLYRFTGLEIGFGLFFAGAVIATFCASDKRAAINDFVALLAPILLAVLLAQILDSNAKIIFTLTVIVALGAVCAYQCVEQFFVSNRIMIEQYKQAPETILDPLGIEPGSFEQMLLEHRLLSKDVRGFFTTGNSAGSFLLLCSFAALAVTLCKTKTHKGIRASLLILAAIVFGLVLTRSKGAITAFVLAAIMLVTYLGFGQWLKAHRKSILIVCLSLFLAGGGWLILYGLQHSRLPGGNSMLVRWQYWQASVRMYINHALAGVGPANFAYFYPRYKLPAALETVTDPHDFLLTILTQFGPIGLIGFLALILIPLWKIIFSGILQPEQQQEGGLSKRLPVIFALIITVVLLAARPLFIKMPFTAGPEVVVYAIFIIYIIQPLIFLIAFRLIVGNGTVDFTDIGVVTAALFCAIIGFLIHNLIDFAFFEQGIYITFWILMACLIASCANRFARFISVKSSVFIKLFVNISVLLFASLYFPIYLLPTVKGVINFQKAADAAAAGQFEKAHNFLAVAANDDSLNPLPLSLDSRLYLNQFSTVDTNNIQLLLQAQKSLQTAIKRNKSDFKNYAHLAEVYRLLAELSQEQVKADWLDKAFASASLAVKCYPGSSQLRLDLAQIAEQLSRFGIALEEYKKAIEIEDAYRQQFEIMYPGRKIFSRLGDEKYNAAKQKIQELSKLLTQ